MSATRHYLDWNATAPLRPEARAALVDAFDVAGNPSSVHAEGRAARRLVEAARERVAALAGARPAEVVFTSGGTEANAAALLGVETVLVSAVEHDSVLASARGAARVPVDGRGVVDLRALERILASERPALVSIMLANNETGVLQPVAEAAELAREHGARVHCDAVQAAGKITVDFTALGVDLMTLSAHKLGGPKGVGALTVREGVELVPLIRGGGQELRRRAGTENVAGIAGFGAAAEAALSALETAGAPMAALRARIEDAVTELAPDAVVYGAGASRLPNTACIGMPGVPAETQVMALDLAGVAVSAGAACSSGKVTRSHVLDAMGVADGAAGCAIRVSLGWGSAVADADAFVAAWRDLYERKARERAA